MEVVVIGLVATAIPPPVVDLLDDRPALADDGVLLPPGEALQVQPVGHREDQQDEDLAEDGEPDDQEGRVRVEANPWRRPRPDDDAESDDAEMELADSDGAESEEAAMECEQTHAKTEKKLVKDSENARKTTKTSECHGQR